MTNVRILREHIELDKKLAEILRDRVVPDTAPAGPVSHLKKLCGSISSTVAAQKPGAS